jgi:hypothetical protein
MDAQVLSNLHRIITNAIYGVEHHKKRFQAGYPEESVLAAGATKARRVSSEYAAVQHEAGWITARRAVVLLTNNRLICGSWVIPVSSIKSATLLRVKAWFAKAFVLKISTDEGHYQFGLQYDSDWEQQTAFPMVIEDSKIGYSFFSIALRIIIFILLILYIIERLS